MAIKCRDRDICSMLMRTFFVKKTDFTSLKKRILPAFSASKIIFNSI